MAEAPRAYDFHAVLDATWNDLLHMDFVPVLEELRNSGVFRHRIFRDLQEKYNTTTEKIDALLRLVNDGGYTKYDQMKKCLVHSGQKFLVDIMEAAERDKPDTRKKLMTQEEKLQEVLKEDLIEYYRKEESTMSVAPLVEQHEAEITKFYVRPPMMVHNKPNAFGQKKRTEKKSGEKMLEEKTNIRSYRELLLNGNDPYKGIYVTADAGMGKTSFAKMLTVTWCEAYASKDKSGEQKSEMSCADEKQVKLAVKTSADRHFTPQVKQHYSDGSDADSFYTEDISTMKKFDFLFLIKLREYENSDKCSLYEMIFEKLMPKLGHECRYTREFLENVLCNKRCLIIADGLDEWSHPKSCEKGEVIPHRKPWPRCTVLTTTRPWKLSSAKLKKADIDRQVEILQLDKTTARKLESRAIAFLNENQESPPDQPAPKSNKKTVNDFEKSVPEQILEQILYIPFVLLQIICLWFGNNHIGKSLCEVYSNIIELTLTRWLVKTDSGHTDCECEPSKEHENIKLKCIENNRHCQRYMPLLLKIGQLAFSTLFNVIREESLLFDKEQVLKYLSKEELKQCLDMGLLSQVKDTTSLTEVRLQLYFPHKTLHEFFCSLFILTNWNNTKTGTMYMKQTISDKCTSVSDILEMSKVFVFVCGLNSEVYSDISRHLATIVSTDQRVIDYRNRVEEDPDLSENLHLSENLRLLEDYQRMQISCFLESTRNQHPECKILIEDMIVGRHMKEDEKQAVKSILTSAAHTLKYLKLYQVSLTDDICSAISTLKNLHALYLDHVYVSNDSLNAASDCISGFMSLQELRLHLRYKPSDTDKKPEQREASSNYLLRSIEAKTLLTYLRLDVDVGQKNSVLDLSRHDKLLELDLRLPLPELHINTKQLVTCRVDRMYGFSAPAASSLLAELHGAPVLKTLTLGFFRNPPPRIDVTALPLLTKFTLEWCDLRDSTLTMSPEMTSLNTITLRETTVNIPRYRELFLSISKLPQPITVVLKCIYKTVGEWKELLFDILGKLPKSVHIEMQACVGLSQKEWRHIVEDMEASPAFCVTRADLNMGLADITFDTVVV